MNVNDWIEKLGTAESEEAERELISMGSCVAEPLIWAASENYPFSPADLDEKGEAAVRILRRLGPKVIETFLAVIEDVDMDAVQAVDFLAKNSLAEPSLLVPVLVRSLWDHQVASHTCTILGEVGSPLSVPDLLDALYVFTPENWDNEWWNHFADPVDNCESILFALGQIRDVSALESVAEFLEHPYDEIRVSAAAALHRIGGPKLEVLQRTYAEALVDAKGQDPAQVIRALLMIGQLGGPGAAQTVTARICDPVPEIWAAALDAIHRISPAGQTVTVGELLLSSLSDSSVRFQALEILHRHREYIDSVAKHMSSLIGISEAEAKSRAIKPLVNATRDENYNFRNKVLRTIARLGRGHAEQPVRAILRRYLRDEQENPHLLDLYEVRNTLDEFGILQEALDAELVFAWGGESQSSDNAVSADLILRIVGNGASINAADAKGQTVVTWACKNAHTELLDDLLGCAVTRGDADAVTLLLRAGADKNGPSYGCSDESLLSEAVFKGHTHIVQLLVSGGAEVNVADSSGWTALMHAAKSHNLGLVSLLLNAGANKNSRDEDGNNALWHAGKPWDASSPTDPRVVAMLRDEAADAALVSLWTDADGKWDGQKAGAITPSAINVALNAGADIEAHDTEGTTALMVAVFAENLEAVRLLLDRGASANAGDSHWRTPLIDAAYQGCLEIVSLLLDNGAEVNAISVDDVTPLMEAARQGHSDIVRLLINAGADKYVLDDLNDTILKIASNGAKGVTIEQSRDTAAVVQEALNADLIALWANGAPSDEAILEILEAGADIDSTDATGRTSLMQACEHGQTETVQLLLEPPEDYGGMLVGHSYSPPGAEVNISQPETGWTPLMFAASWGHAEIVNLLLAADADKDLADANGNTALWHAQHSEEGISEEAKARTIFALQEALNAEFVSLWTDKYVWSLEKAQAIAKWASDEYGLTALMFAAMNGRTKALSLLIDAGADIEAADRDGSTALMFAASSGHTQGLKRLLRQKPKLEVADTEGCTALMRACKRGQMESVRLLLKARANPNTKDKDGMTVLMQACEQSHMEMVRLLTDNGANVNAVDKDGCTAQMRASRRGQGDLANLLRADANNDAADKNEALA